MLLVAIATSFLIVPEAQALSCASTFADVVGERVQLNACVHDFDDSDNDDDARFQFGGGVTVAVGDLLLVAVATDRNGRDLVPPAGWNQLEDSLSGRDMTSNVWTRVATAADVAKPEYIFEWTNNDEQNQGYMLLFKGTSGLFNFASAKQADSNNPFSPAVTANSANNLILRMANIDRDSVDVDDQGPNMPGHTDLIQATNSSSDDGGKGKDKGKGDDPDERVSISGAFTHKAAAGFTAPPSYYFVATANEGSHVRTLSIEPYEFRFSMPNTTASTCGAQLVTLSVTDRLGNPITSFVGTVSLSASNSGSATWADGGALNGGLTDSGSGNATYTFVAGDAGVAVFEYHNPIANSVNFGVSYTPGDSSFSENPSFDPTLVVDNSCVFQVDLDDGNMGTCSIEQVTVSLFDSEDVAATHYTGTITIQNGGDGDYAAVGENGTFDNGTLNDGNALYTFTLADVGQLVMNYTDTTAGVVNIGLTDFTYPVASSANLTVGDCKIAISHSTESDVCSLEAVNISVRDHLDVLVGSFVGTITLTDGAVSGSWAVDTATNALVDNGGGSVGYTFAPGDGGDIDLFYGLEETASVDFNATSTTPGFASPSGAGDPLLNVSTCTPAIPVQACVAGTSTSIAIGGQKANPLLRGRMVLMAIGLEGADEVTSATFNGAPMILIYEEINLNGAGNITELWGIGDYNLPAVAGSYTGSFVTAADGPSMCLLYGTDIEQVLPGPSSGATSADRVNGSQAQNTQDAIAAITTAADNALVISLIGNGSGGSDYPAAASSPNISMTKLFDAPDPGGGAEFEASSGILATAGAITVTESWTTAPNRHSHIVASFNPLPLTPAVPSEIRLAHSTESDSCSLEPITISITNALGALATDFTGTITITNSAGAGTWTVNSATNALVDNGGGSIDYTFALGDSGDIELYFELNQVATVDFNVTTTTPGIAAPSGTDDLTLDVATCYARISVAAEANVCSVSETLTLTILDRDFLVPTLPGSYGSVTLTASNSKGDFISTDGNLANLNNGGPDDGIAAYLFDGTEGASVDFEYSTSTIGALTFGASAPLITFDAAGSTEDLNVFDCEFRISFDGGASGADDVSDVCSLQAMTIAVWNVNGGSSAIVTDYVGTANINAGSGSWFEQGGGSPGVLTDGFAQDGSATYEFVGGDAGEVTLDFTTNSSGTLNFAITQGAISADNTSWDPDLVVALCTFRISMVDETMTACTTEDVTITAYDSNNVIATNYTGTVSLSTSTIHGNWTGVGVTDTPGDDNGVATVAITTGGTVTITFEDVNFEDVNVNLVAGEMTEAGAFDPDLEVTGCLPGIINSVCFSGASGGTGSLPLSASPGPGRMVVMWVFHATDPSPQTVTGTTFNATAMTELGQVNAANTGVSMWGILDANLPAGGASYAGAYTFDSAPANTASMCMAEIADVKQTFVGLVVGTNTFGATGDLTTSITTTANNALVLSGAVTDRDVGGNTWFNSVLPDPPMTMRFSGSNDQNPSNGTAGGSDGNKPVSGLISVNDIDNQAGTTSASHIVVSLNPLVAGDPEADGYVPVLLHETLSGNISYRAVGSTLRTHSNSATSPDANGQCSFVPIGTGSTANLTMPAGSTVERAFLYWAGSGTEAQSDLNIEFGHSTDLPGLSAITGEELFMIIDAAGSGGLDYFASYKDVTADVATTGNGEYTFRQLDVQNGIPWSSGSACAGGWGLVVVYSNTAEAFRVANLFHGFQPFQNSAFTLVPRNFRMKTTDNDSLLFEPNGQITHITVEGDEDLDGGAGDGEALGIQDDIGSDVFNVLTNSYNPATGDFNSTVTRPSYFLDTGGTNLYQFDSTGGDDGAGYENDAEVPNHPDLTPYSPSDAREQGDSWGFDIDTHYITGNDSTGELWNFSQPDSEAEQITTQYSSGQDLVLLISEVISVTNFDLADLEVFKSVSGPLKVDQAQDYVITVTNNGNNGSSGGEATGLIVVADILPNGMTLNSVAGTDWTCYTGADRYSCTFDILNDCIDYGTGADDIGCETVANQLSTDESLPVLTANVQVGGFAFFPDESNPAKNVARMQHNGANSPAEPACIALISGSPGVLPDPANCQRSPQFDNRNDLNGGAIDINDIDDKDGENNNVDSIITDVIGLKTDLAIDKLVDGALEVGETQTYTITVTNNGPDDTSETINVADTAPAGITFTAASGPGWSCTVTPGAFGNIDCDYAATLPALSSAAITLSVNVTGAAGVSVTNTAQVTPGIHNFDTTNTANNTDSDTSVIVAPPAASQEEFIVSVSVAGNASTIGGLGPFENDDYVNYNPQTDVGTGFYDDSVTGDVKDANAVHVFKNGHIAISAKGPATSTVGGLTFQPEDVVVYDPILNTATMLFDGSTIFTGTIGAEHDIDAVFVKEGGQIVFSVFGDGNPLTDDDVCILLVCFSEADVVQYDPSDDSVTILIDGYDSADGDDEILTSEVQVNGIYIRVDDTDPNDVKEIYVLSVNGTEQVGACASCDPAAGTGVSPDDIIEVDLTGANPVTQSLFVGDAPFGVFTPSSGTREIDAIHVKEDGYHGHFSISQSQAGSTCAAGQITIRKHEFNHDVDTDYAGSIEITTDDGGGGVGTWSIADGDGALTNVGADNGVATYTFVPSDLGQVTLYLTETDVSTIDVNVSNRLVDEQEDPAFIFNNVISDITYKDEFTAAAFDNNDGLTVWKNPWSEVDNAAADIGVSNGNVQIAAGSMQFTTEPGNTSAEMSREADLSLVFPISNDLVKLSFDYKYSSLNGADRFVAEVRESSGDAWEEVWVRDAGGSNGAFQSSGEIDLKAAIELSRVFNAWSSTTEIRFRVDTGYTGTSRMFIDNVLLETGTTKCGVGVMDHYEIRIDNVTGASAFEVGGISCLASQITISGHDSNHVSATPNESVTFRALSQTLANKGTWSAPYVGTGPFVESGTVVDGLSTYTFPADENQVVLNFNYTDPTLDPEKINFNITSAFPVDANEDPTLRVGDVLLRIFNETQNGPNLIPTQISGKSSNVAAPSSDVLTLQVITTDLTDTTQCMPLVDVDETLTFSFALECIDDDSCNSSSLVTPVATVHNIDNGAATPVEIPNLDSNAGTGASSYGDVDLIFKSFTNSGIAAQIVLMYQDAGNVQLHAELDLETNVNANNDALNLTPGAGVGTPLQASSNVFTVRPFGLDIDFPTGGEGRGTKGLADASYALNADGNTFAVAGVGFTTRVRGVQYDAADDLNTDGIPDTDSELWNNLSTPNFGNDSTANTYKVQVNSTTIAPAGGYGALTNNEFATFSDGAQAHTMTFDEVGIVDLEASLLLTADDTAANYLLSGVQLTGHVRDVGRFYPASFELSGGAILSRAQASMEAMCINPTSPFTYTGEEFQISAMLEAQNAAGVRTRNYVGDGVSTDDYAKLDINNLAESNFFIFEEPAAVDANLSARRVIDGTAPDMTWPDDAAAEASRGIGMLSGNLIFSRQSGGSEDGPFADLSVGLNTSDSDGAALELGINIDGIESPLADDVALIATESFRYGRLMIDNTFGPETEDLTIPFRIEYWNGSGWVTNTLDNCTVLSYNASEDDATMRSTFYVDDSWEGALDGNANGQDDGETVIENAAVVADSDIVVSISGGRTGEVSGVDVNADNQDDDRPLRTSAPGEGLEGSVLIEFDLSHGSLSYPLDFLAYDWRTPGDVLEETEDGNYVNNPRGQANFGLYRGHDRVINWQEIYIGPTP